MLQLCYLSIVEDFLHQSRLRALNILHLQLHPVKLLVKYLLRPQAPPEGLITAMASDFLGGALGNDALQLFSDHFAEELSVSEGSR